MKMLLNKNIMLIAQLLHLYSLFKVYINIKTSNKFKTRPNTVKARCQCSIIILFLFKLNYNLVQNLVRN